jgi:hypothetical protein
MTRAVKSACMKAPAGLLPALDPPRLAPAKEAS